MTRMPQSVQQRTRRRMAFHVAVLHDLVTVGMAA
jgi:hypothetical protein